MLIYAIIASVSLCVLGFWVAHCMCEHILMCVVMDVRGEKYRTAVERGCLA